MGRHICPSCAKRSQIKRSFAQMSLTLIIVWAVAIPIVILLYRSFGYFWSLLGLVPGVLVGLPCDKMLDEKFRGRGIAKSFLKQIEQERPFGAVVVALEVSLHNPRARALYESMGFNDRHLRMMTRRLAPVPSRRS